MTIPVDRLHDFPILDSCVYLDSAATTQKPRAVIEAMNEFYLSSYATVNRSVYALADRATEQYDHARDNVASYINATSSREVVFTRGTTDSLNIIAESLSQSVLERSSRILISAMEHHSNIVPWQMAARRSGSTLEVIPITESGELDIEALKAMLELGNVAVVALTHCSNVLGTINPIARIADLLDETTIFVVDGAQSIAHMNIDVQELGCDIFCFSAHKMYGPTGIGVLWGRQELLERLPPSRGGSDMIDKVEFHTHTCGQLPLKFEPGTPMIVEAIGLSCAIDYIKDIERKYAWEHELYAHLVKGLTAISSVELLGTAVEHGPLQSFIISGAHPLDVATLLDLKGIAVRSGHLCCQPLLKTLGRNSAIRASLSFYNTHTEIDHFLNALESVCKQLL